MHGGAEGFKCVIGWYDNVKLARSIHGVICFMYYSIHPLAQNPIGLIIHLGWNKEYLGIYEGRVQPYQMFFVQARLVRYYLLFRSSYPI